MNEKIQKRYFEVLQKIETEGLPFSVNVADLTFQEAEKLRYELMNKKLRVEIYEEFKELYLGVYEK
jgi:protein associated with RNAse G/E